MITSFHFAGGINTQNKASGTYSNEVLNLYGYEFYKAAGSMRGTMHWYIAIGRKVLGSRVGAMWGIALHCRQIEICKPGAYTVAGSRTGGRGTKHPKGSQGFGALVRDLEWRS